MMKSNDPVAGFSVKKVEIAGSKMIVLRVNFNVEGPSDKQYLNLGFFAVMDEAAVGLPIAYKYRAQLGQLWVQGDSRGIDLLVESMQDEIGQRLVASKIVPADFYDVAPSGRVVQ